jgi:hypothetical protein
VARAYLWRKFFLDGAGEGGPKDVNWVLMAFVTRDVVWACVTYASPTCWRGEEGALTRGRKKRFLLFFSFVVFHRQQQQTIANTTTAQNKHNNKHNKEQASLTSTFSTPIIPLTFDLWFSLLLTRRNRLGWPPRWSFLCAGVGWAVRGSPTSTSTSTSICTSTSPLLHVHPSIPLTPRTPRPRVQAKSNPQSEGAL